MLEQQSYLANQSCIPHRDVAPANGPLKRFLESIDISLPDIPITANVDGSFYHQAEDVRSAILGKLAPQSSR